MWTLMTLFQSKHPKLKPVNSATPPTWARMTVGEEGKCGFMAPSRHAGCADRPQFSTPGGNTQICSCSSPASPPYLHLCAIVRDTADCTLKCVARAHTPRELQCARLGQLSCEVSCADWTYADPFRFDFYLFIFFCADLLIGASSRHHFAMSFVWVAWEGWGCGGPRCVVETVKLRPQS